MGRGLKARMGGDHGKSPIRAAKGLAGLCVELISVMSRKFPTRSEIFWRSLLGFVIVILPLPGGNWLLSSWLPLPWRLGLLVQVSFLGLVGTALATSCRLVRYRYTFIRPPEWLTHPACRLLLIVPWTASIAALPFGLLSNSDLSYYLGQIGCPLVGLGVGATWLRWQLISSNRSQRTSDQTPP